MEEHPHEHLEAIEAPPPGKNRSSSEQGEPAHVIVSPQSETDERSPASDEMTTSGEQKIEYETPQSPLHAVDARHAAAIASAARPKATIPLIRERYHGTRKTHAALKAAA